MLQRRYTLYFPTLVSYLENEFIQEMKAYFLIISTEYISIFHFPNIQKNYPETFHQCSSHVHVSNSPHHY